jgi:ubiquinone/menaquinone biosynthesis C-methylase UbiE
MDEPLEKCWRRKFQRYAQKYEKESEISGWSDHGLSRRITTFGRVLDSARLPSDALIVDLGCGAGTYCRFLRKRGFRIIGLDYSLPMLKKAKKLRGNEGLQFLNGEAYNLPLSDQSVDVVVCIGVLQTLTDEKRALKEMRRVLKLGGVLFLDGINALGLNELMKWKPGNQLRTYNPFILRKYLKRNGFQSLKITGTYILPSSFLSLENYLESKKVFQKMDYLLFLFVFFARAFILVGVKK